MKSPLALVLLLSLTLLSCRDVVVTEPESSSRVADFETIWSQANTVYPFFQQKRINWDSIHAVYLPLVQRAKGDESFAVLVNLLGELKDIHVYITGPIGSQLSPFESARTQRDKQSFDLRAVTGYFGKPLSYIGDGNIQYATRDDSIGYIRLASFGPGSWVNTFDPVLDSFRNTKGLIIDVRHNPGGMVNVHTFIAERFISSTIAYLPSYSRLGNPSFLPATPRGSFTYTKPVVILTNGVSASAAEHFAELMRRGSTVTVIGDTTAGAGGNGGDLFTLTEGEKVQLSTVDFRRYDGVPIEWNGVVPDIVVLQTEKDVRAGRDPQLERAFRALE